MILNSDSQAGHFRPLHALDSEAAARFCRRCKRYANPVRNMCGIFLIGASLNFQAMAEGDSQPVTGYSEGSYGNIPFQYPAVLLEADMEKIVLLIEGLTTEEIVAVIYSRAADEVKILTCEKGTIISKSCHDGRGFTFTRGEVGWQLPENPEGTWQE